MRDQDAARSLLAATSPSGACLPPWPVPVTCGGLGVCVNVTGPSGAAAAGCACDDASAWLSSGDLVFPGSAPCVISRPAVVGLYAAALVVFAGLVLPTSAFVAWRVVRRRGNGRGLGGRCEAPTALVCVLDAALVVATCALRCARPESGIGESVPVTAVWVARSAFTMLVAVMGCLHAFGEAMLRRDPLPHHVKQHMRLFQLAVEPLVTVTLVAFVGALPLAALRASSPAQLAQITAAYYVGSRACIAALVIGFAHFTLGPLVAALASAQLQERVFTLRRLRNLRVMVGVTAAVSVVVGLTFGFVPLLNTLASYETPATLLMSAPALMVLQLFLLRQADVDRAPVLLQFLVHVFVAHRSFSFPGRRSTAFGSRRYSPFARGGARQPQQEPLLLGFFLGGPGSVAGGDAPAAAAGHEASNPGFRPRAVVTNGGASRTTTHSNTRTHTSRPPNSEALSVESSRLGNDALLAHGDVQWVTKERA